VSADPIDADIWARVERTLKNPKRVLEGLSAVMASDDGPAGRELTAAASALGDLERQQAALVDNLALVTGPAAALVAERINALTDAVERMRATRARLAAQLDEQRAARERLVDFVRACERVASKLATANEVRRRWVLRQLGVTVRVYDRSHAPRWEAEAAIPLDDGLDDIDDEGVMTYGCSRRS
jgi:hypothetical protein